MHHVCHMQRGKVSRLPGMAYRFAPCVDVDSKLHQFTKTRKLNRLPNLRPSFDHCRDADVPKTLRISTDDTVRRKLLGSPRIVFSGYANR